MVTGLFGTEHRGRVSPACRPITVQQAGLLLPPQRQGLLVRRVEAVPVCWSLDKVPCVSCVSLGFNKCKGSGPPVTLGLSASVVTQSNWRKRDTREDFKRHLGSPVMFLVSTWKPTWVISVLGAPITVSPAGAVVG